MSRFQNTIFCPLARRCSDETWAVQIWSCRHNSGISGPPTFFGHHDRLVILKRDNKSARKFKTRRVSIAGPVRRLNGVQPPRRCLLSHLEMVQSRYTKSYTLIFSFYFSPVRNSSGSSTTALTLGRPKSLPNSSPLKSCFRLIL